jgi:hypothetical protein
VNGSTPIYTGVRASKTGLPVPTYRDGSAAHSLYDPVKEAAQLARTFPDGAFVVFAGIGGGYHIREYLASHPGVACAVAESGTGNMDALRTLVDVSDIASDPRVTLIPDCTDESAVDVLSRAYVPALHGDFRVIALRSWQDRNEAAFDAFGTLVRRALDRVSADYSVQSHFGKLWFRNILLNLSACRDRPAPIHIGRPTVTRAVSRTVKKAVIAAAGPSLEKALPSLRAEREAYAVFSTDTAFGTLMDSNIVPDYFVSVDAQAISARHVMRPLRPETTVIIDVCGNPDIGIEAARRGSPVVFAAGAHPLARYAARWGHLPLIDASSGTVTLAARQAARALGYEDVTLVGADFAYVGGKPYARGTYLDATFSKDSSRLAPAETLYTALMFRTEVRRTEENGTLTYTTDVLDRYALAAKEACGTRNAGAVDFWATEAGGGFPFDAFIASYRDELTRSLSTGSCHDDVLKTLLPLMAWRRDRNTSNVIKLALELIARYTAVS